MSKPSEILPACRFFDVVLWLMRRRSRVRVVGRSMWPVLRPGDEVFVEPFTGSNRGNRSLQVGDIVTLWHPTQPGLKIVKRIEQIDRVQRIEPEKRTQHRDRRDDQTHDRPYDRYFVRGDNPEESTDSRQFGWIDADQIIGKVVCRFDVD